MILKEVYKLAYHSPHAPQIPESLVGIKGEFLCNFFIYLCSIYYILFNYTSYPFCRYSRVFNFYFRKFYLIPFITRTSLFVFYLLAYLICFSAVDATEFREIVVEKTRINILLKDGSILSNNDLIGAEIVLRSVNDYKVNYRIDGFKLDPNDPEGEIVLYFLSVWDKHTQEWKVACPPDYEGQAMGIPIKGVWTADGRYDPLVDTFEFVCTNGAIAKCMRMGYKPWKNDESDVSLEKYLQSCTYMIRADYCGNGSSHTREGTYINNYDTIGIVEREESERVRDFDFEAAWGAEGAICVHKVRVPELLRVDELERMCPEKLKDKVGENCDKEEMLSSPEVLMLNDSM